jgi:site-specific recombinase XerD
MICMPPALVAAMATYLDIRRDRGLATDRVFVSVQGDQPIAVVTVRRLCRVITEKTGIKVAPHLLRHTCATLMRQEGVTDRLSMEQLGHSSLAVLQKYSHVAPGERSEAIARINVDLGEVTTGASPLARGTKASASHGAGLPSAPSRSAPSW